MHVFNIKGRSIKIFFYTLYLLLELSYKKVSVWIKEQKVAICKELEVVGKQALENNTVRNATLVTEEDSYLLLLFRDDFQRIMQVFDFLKKNIHIYNKRHF